MAFVAEYISKEDIKKYDIINRVDQRLAKYHYDPQGPNEIKWLEEIFGLFLFVARIYLIQETDILER